MPSRDDRTTIPTFAASTGAATPADVPEDSRDQHANDGWSPTADAGELAEMLELSDIATLREVTHPIRGTILRRLRHPHTVAEVAAAMNVPVTRLYHHVNQLVKAGLIRVVATRQVAAVTERRYQVVARSFRLSAEVVEGLDRTELAQAMGSMFDVAKLGLHRFVESTDHDAIPEATERSLLALSELQLTRDELGELIGHLSALCDDFRNRATDPRPGTEPITLVLAAFPDVPFGGIAADEE